MNTPRNLRELENTTIYILREAYRKHRRLAFLWSMGKDSTTLLWMARKAFFGRLPFPVLHVDTSYKFPQMYEYRRRMTREWGLDLIVHRNEEALAAGMGPANHSTLECCNALKTQALRQAIERYDFEALLLGIRRDEHGIRAKERVFSPRDEDFRWNYLDQPPELWDLYQARSSEMQHLRVHPLLHWREVDIWEYVRAEGVPLPDLYFATSGTRYRSIGCRTCCRPFESSAATVAEVIAELRDATEGERAGRAQDKEDEATMQKLRALGYM